MIKSIKLKCLEKLITVIVILIIIVQPSPILANSTESYRRLDIQGNPEGVAPIPPEARLEDVSQPDHIIGNGTPESCTSEAFLSAVALGGTIVFDGGDKPFTIHLTKQALIYNDQKEDIIIDGGGLVTLDGGGTTRLLYMNTCDPNLTWTTSHCQNQDNPRLTVQNIKFANGNSTKDLEYTGGGAIWVRGGRFKAINCSFTNNVCESLGPDVGGGAIRVFSQYEGKPVYIVNCTFGGEAGKGNIGSNGGAISSIGVSWTIINSLFSYNEAIGNGGNPKKSGTPGGGSGGAIYNDGNEMTLTIIDSIIQENKVNTHGSGIFFVTNNHTGTIRLYDTTIANNRGGSWYPVHPEISMHSDTSLTITNAMNTTSETGSAIPTSSTVIIDGIPYEFEAYMINNNNYFKLRDIAKVLSGSDKQFEITWDSNTQLIQLLSNQTYSDVGGELIKTEMEKARQYKKVIPSINIDGMTVNLKAYLINNNNYFKLRDLGTIFNFGIGWDGGLNVISVDTRLDYVMP